MSVENKETILYLLVFVIGIPLYLFFSKSLEMYKYYYPFIIMFAIILTESGSPDLFKDLYPKEPINLQGFITKNIINGLVIIGILYYSITKSMKTGNIYDGLMRGLLSFIIVFLLAQEFIPYIINRYDSSIRELTSIEGNSHRYLLGFIAMFSLIGFQYIVLLNM